jgi:hypothetical protein
VVPVSTAAADVDALSLVVATVFLVRPVEVARVHGIEAARASLVAMVTEAAAVRNTHCAGENFAVGNGPQDAVLAHCIAAVDRKRPDRITTVAARVITSVIASGVLQAEVLVATSALAVVAAPKKPCVEPCGSD